MRAYMTNGTYDFLKKLPIKYPAITFFFMKGSANDLAYYEGSKKNVFQAGRKYDVLLQSGEIQEKGYLVMNHIPVTEEGRPVFEDNFKKRRNEVDRHKGFQAFRLLKPIKGNTYVVLTQWDTEGSYENWKNSKGFQEAHKGVKPPAYFADRPFVQTYHMIEEDDESL